MSSGGTSQTPVAQAAGATTGTHPTVGVTYPKLSQASSIARSPFNPSKPATELTRIRRNESSDGQNYGSLLKETTDSSDPQLKNTRKKGNSVFTSSVLCIVATLGAGTLTFPFSFMTIGFIPGLVLLSIMAYLAHYMLELLIETVDIVVESDRQNGRSINNGGVSARSSYAALSAHLLSHRMSLFTQFCQASQVFAALIAYIVAAGAMCVSIMIELGVSVKNDESSDEDTSSSHQFFSLNTRDGLYDWSVVVLSLCFVLPLGLAPELSALKYTSYLGAICVLYLATAMVIEFLSACLNDYSEGNSDERSQCLNFSGYSLWFGHDTFVDSSLLLGQSNSAFEYFIAVTNAMPLYIFGYACNQTILEVFGELRAHVEPESLKSNFSLRNLFSPQTQAALAKQQAMRAENNQARGGAAGIAASPAAAVSTPVLKSVKSAGVSSSVCCSSSNKDCDRDSGAIGTRIDQLITTNNNNDEDEEDTHHVIPAAVVARSNVVATVANDVNDEMQKPIDTMKDVILNTVVFITLIYMVIATFGFFRFSFDTCGNILLNDFTETWVSIDNSDSISETQASKMDPSGNGTRLDVILVAIIATTINLIVASPTFVYCFRINALGFYKNWIKKSQKQYTKNIYDNTNVNDSSDSATNVQSLLADSKVNFGIALCQVLSTIVISLFLRNIIFVFELLGATLYPIIIYVLPTMFYRSVTAERGGAVNWRRISDDQKHSIQRRRGISMMITVMVCLCSLVCFLWKIVILVTGAESSQC